jgi:DNA-directed RNA polymerase specialized sigma24 family protein
MHITRRLGHRAYQRIRAEHLAEEARRASASADDDAPPPKPTKQSRERERAEKLRDRYDCLFLLEHFEKVVPWLDTWLHLERTVGAQERHDFLESFIRRAQHDPHRHLAEIVFLLIVFGPVRGSAVKALRNATFVERIDVRAVERAGRSAAWMVNQMERERLDSAAVEAVLTAIARYPEPRPEALFPWLKNTIGFRLLDLVREEIAGSGPPRGAIGAEQIAVANTLDDLQELEPPRMAADSPKRRALPRVAMERGLPGVAWSYSEHHEIREVCQRAVGRLTPGQQQVIEYVVLGDYAPQELADRRRVKRSTIYNLRNQAEDRLERDDVFFVELHHLRVVRDRARLAYISARHPDGHLTDGRRRIAIAA